MESDSKCMPTPPKRVGREFVRQYYTLMNRSPQHMHCFYSEEAKFIHDDIDPTERRKISVEGKTAIRDVMLERIPNFQHTSTKIHTVDTIETQNEGLVIQITGEISFNKLPMRQFSQTFILIPKSPFQYFVQNDIFHFCDFESFEPSVQGQSSAITEETMTSSAQADWGTQCEEEQIEPYEERNESVPRGNLNRGDGDGRENEVKLDTSDSGLSSDAEKAIMDIQSHHLRSILQEPKSITKESVMNRGPTPPASTENDPASVESDAQPAEDTNRTQLFRDSCILTVGNVVNPNIEFDDAKRDEIASSEKEKMQEGGDNASKSDDYSSSGKMKYRKRKDRQRKRSEMPKEKSFDESLEILEENQSTEKNVLTEAVVVQKESENLMKSESSVDKTPVDKKPVDEMPVDEMPVDETPIDKTPVDKPSESTTTETTDQPADQETPKSIPEMKTYADLAKAGKTEWTDEPFAKPIPIDQNKARPPPLVRRTSRTERTAPSSDAGQSSRSSPKNDLLQVFIGNIPHTAEEEDILNMFSRFGRLTRIRLHTNTRKEWLPRYAFITYENIQSVRQCLMRKPTFYWPENSPDGQKLNVNGDPTIDIWDDFGNEITTEPRSRGHDFKQFSRNFTLARDSNNRRSSNMDKNMSDSMKTERRKSSNRP